MIDTIGQQLPTLSLIALPHGLVKTHLDYAASWRKLRQIQWCPKKSSWIGIGNAFFFRSKINSSAEQRKNKSFIGIEKRIELKCVTYHYQYLSNKRQAFIIALRLPTANYRISQRTSKQFLITTVQPLRNKKFSFHLTSMKNGFRCPVI